MIEQQPQPKEEQPITIAVQNEVKIGELCLSTNQMDLASLLNYAKAILEDEVFGKYLKAIHEKKEQKGVSYTG